VNLNGFFDIETQDWDKFVCGGLTTDGETIRYYWDENQFGYALLALEGDVWAWNGGLYDAIWLADWLERKRIKFTCTFAGTRIVSLTLGSLRVRDSAALIPMSLQKASTALGEPISKATGLICSCNRSCGGYCRIRRYMPDDERMVLETYLGIDVRTGWQVMEALFNHAARAGYELTATVGGSVWRTMKEMLGIGPAFWLRGRDYEQARAGYYGGRVFVGQLLASAGHRSDVHSAYPAALSSVSLPHGEYVTLASEKAAKALDNERPGIYEATVDIPESFIPPLPWRSSSGRIIYPVGIARGSWSLPELRYALDECGCTLVRIHSAIVWSDTEVLFDGLMNQGFAVRGQFPPKTAFYDWQKWFMNSGTGKFAERPEKEQMLFNLPATEIMFCNPGNPLHWDKGCRWGRCSGWCGAMTPLTFDGNIWLQTKWRLSDCAHVQWAAYLTATQRIKWHRAALRTHGVIYGDTDSIYSVDRLPSDCYGEALGTFGYEGSLAQWVCIAPKTYAYLDENGVFVCRGKGIPNIDEKAWRAFERGETVIVDRGVSGLRSAARNSRAGATLFSRKHLERKRHGRTTPGSYIGDRRILSDGYTTGPITVRDQTERERR